MLKQEKLSTKIRVCYNNNYGHFLRDSAMWIYYHLSREGLLSKPDHKLLFLAVDPRIPKFDIRLVEFLETVFGGEVYHSMSEWREAGHGEAPVLCDVDGEPSRVDPEVLDCWGGIRPRDHELTKDNYFNLIRRVGKKRRGTILYMGDEWGGDTAEYPKECADNFRDHCLKAYEVDPKLKKDLLYVPRHPSARRVLIDESLEKILKKFCLDNGYRFVHWVNDRTVSIKEQMKRYSQSEIIVGANGGDFANVYWTSSEQLIIEVMCSSPRVDTGFSGFCGAYKSESISNYFLNLYGQRIENCGSQHRNWNIIRTPEECNRLDLSRLVFEASLENKIEIEDLLNKHIYEH